MTDSREKKAFTALVWQRSGSRPPKLVWILDEREDGFEVEEISFGQSYDAPPKRAFLSSKEWTRDEKQVKLEEDAPVIGVPWPMSTDP